MSEIEKRSIAEALILVSPEPIPLVRLAKLIPRCAFPTPPSRPWRSSRIGSP